MPTAVDELRERMLGHVMARDKVTKNQAAAVLDRLGPGERTRLELELRDGAPPPFTSDYDPCR